MNEHLTMGPADLTLTQRAEACVLRAYPDPGTGGAPWTIGWGHTGPDVRAGMVITQKQANAWLISDMRRAELAVRRCVRVPLTQDEFVALCDLAFNIGNGNFDTSTLLSKLNGGDVQGAIDEFAKWNRGGGQVLVGLVTRREAERALFTLGANYALKV